jgi:hypothetical protein
VIDNSTLDRDSQIEMILEEAGSFDDTIKTASEAFVINLCVDKYEPLVSVGSENC